MEYTKKFLTLASTPYHEIEADGVNEMEHNFTNKNAWGRAGVALFKALAKDVDGVAVNVSFNKSGSIDRGYVSGFINSTDGTKTIYVSINDGMRDILYRTAKHAKDYTGGSNNTASISIDGLEQVKSFIQSNIK